MNLRAERVLDSGDELGECPIWDERLSALWWIDIHGSAIKRYDGENVRILPMPEAPGSIALRREGGMLVALASGVFLIGTEEPKLLVRPAGHLAELRFNDGRCDRAGRFWVGTLAEPDFAARGILYRVEADGSYRVFRTGIQVPNSLAWSPDGRTMYFADSPRHKIWAFDYDGERGEIFRRARLRHAASGISRWLVRRRRRLPVERRVGRGPHRALYARRQDRSHRPSPGRETELLLLRRLAARHALHHERRSRRTVRRHARRERTSGVPLRLGSGARPGG